MVSLLKDNPLYNDVEPIYSTEEELACVKIALSEEFIDRFAYMRALIDAGEYSKRSFDLTTECIQLNSGNYSIWKFRRDCLKKLNLDLNEELQMISEVIRENPKNYQVWRHRQEIVQHLDDYSHETSFLLDIIKDDDKNYHAWQYRVWLLKNEKLKFNSEITFTNYLLVQDLRNNSAWHYRQVVFSESGKLENDEELYKSEVDFVLDAIKTVDNNESAWNYYFWLFTLSKDKESIIKYLDFTKTLDTESSRVQKYIFFIKVYSRLLNSKDTKLMEIDELKKEIKNCCNMLIQYDLTHTRYWEKIIQSLKM
ncbi:Protein prenyltransferase, alpha subunit repeat-containing protein [Strongyloides ratti]|uniref:Protein farnesyltransferase/geranylgeranyltransferase type-1 subunit alpha n=1 Tax=Strongyloides ratti TaxID=34506 RepID=A0A090L3N6_STRRB|nr:Protein prenyltransferase, alpha subunit repeat-containing protein [Strongyloides ratti]CEF64431.1 Protein prenyltransferase, alpha subunit repeat-containing protein [Strongyloides ratti]